MRRILPLGLSALLLAFPGVVRAQAWLLDPAVAPEIYAQNPVTTDLAFAPDGDGHVLVYGEFSHLNGRAASGFARVSIGGVADTTFAPELIASERVAMATRLGDGRILAVVTTNAITPSAPGALALSGPASAFGILPPPITAGSSQLPRGPASMLVRFLASGQRDAAFAPLACDGLPKLLPLADGRIVVWGSFTALGAQPRNSLARLEADGRLDATFIPALASRPAFVTAAAAGANGAVVVSGYSYDASNRAVYFFTRLSAAGNVDAAFPAAMPSGTFSLLAVEADGSVLAGNYALFRYTAAGALDPAFSLQIPALKSLSRLVPLPDGRKIVEAAVGPANSYGVPAVFVVDATGRVETDLRTRPGAQSSQRLLAVLSDGSALLQQGSTALVVATGQPVPASDPSVSASVAATAGANVNVVVPIETSPFLANPTLHVYQGSTGTIRAFAAELTRRRSASIQQIKTDGAGRAIVAGTFTHVDGEPRPGLARFRADGALDRAFAPASGTGVLLVPPDGRLIVQTSSRIARLRDDGSIDPGFSVSADLVGGEIKFLAVAPDGRLLVAAFENGPRSEDKLKLMWLGENGQRLSTLSTVFGGFSYWGIIAYPADGVTSTDGSVASAIANSAAANPTAPIAASNASAIAAAVSAAVSAAGASTTTGPITGPTVGTTPNVTSPIDPGVATPVVPIGTPIVPVVPPGLIHVVPQPIASAEVLADNRLLVTGFFSYPVSNPIAGVVWLAADGSVEAPPAPADGDAVTVSVSSLARTHTVRPQADGRALVFENRWDNTQARTRTLLTRIDRHGVVEPAFAPELDVTGLAVQILPDGALLIGNQLRTPNGAIDANFAPQLRNGATTTNLVAAARSGRHLWIGGNFTQVDGQPRSGLARFETREVVGITFGPQSQSVVAGREVSFSVVLGTNQPATLQWTFNGAPIPGANSPTLRVSDAGLAQAGDYRAIVTIGGQTFTSAPATLTVERNTAQLINFSARSLVTPAAPQIAGFVLANASPRDVLLRATGRGLPINGVATESFAPGTAPFGPRIVSFASWVLPVPILTLHNPSGPVATDRGGALSAVIAARATEAGAFALRTYPAAPADTIYGSALALPLAPGAYTAITTSGDGASGDSLFELYDVARGTGAAPLIRNVAIRARLAAGGSLASGFVLSGNGPRRVLLRGLGPALVAFGLTDALSEPRLRVLANSNGAILATNTGWANDPTLASAAVRSGAFPLAPGSRDAAVLVKLEPGTYTAEVASVTGAAGTVMLELYVLED